MAIKEWKAKKMNFTRLEKTFFFLTTLSIMLTNNTEFLCIQRHKSKEEYRGSEILVWVKMKICWSFVLKEHSES